MDGGIYGSFVKGKVFFNTLEEFTIILRCEQGQPSLSKAGEGGESRRIHSHI